MHIDYTESGPVPAEGTEVWCLDTVTNPTIIAQMSPMGDESDGVAGSVNIGIYQVQDHAGDGRIRLYPECLDPYVSVYARAGGCEHLDFNPVWNTNDEGIEALRRGDGYLHWCGPDGMHLHLRILAGLYRYLADRFANTPAWQPYLDDLAFLDDLGTLADARFIRYEGPFAS